MCFGVLVIGQRFHQTENVLPLAGIEPVAQGCIRRAPLASQLQLRITKNDFAMVGNTQLAPHLQNNFSLAAIRGPCRFAGHKPSTPRNGTSDLLDEALDAIKAGNGASRIAGMALCLDGSRCLLVQPSPDDGPPRNWRRLCQIPFAYQRPAFLAL